METMPLKGKPRDMNKWREVLLDPNVHFPGESSEYRRARDELLEAEAELRRLNEQQGEVPGVVRTGQELAGHLQHDVPALVGRPTSGCPRGQDSRAAARRAAVAVMHIGRRRARGCCFSP